MWYGGVKLERVEKNNRAFYVSRLSKKWYYRHSVETSRYWNINFYIASVKILSRDTSSALLIELFHSVWVLLKSCGKWYQVKKTVYRVKSTCHHECQCLYSYCLYELGRTKRPMASQAHNTTPNCIWRRRLFLQPPKLNHHRYYVTYQVLTVGNPHFLSPIGAFRFPHPLQIAS